MGLLVSHGDVLPPGAVDTGPRGPRDVRFELHHDKGWVPAPVLAEAIGVDVDVVTAVGDYPKYLEVREGRVGHQQWVRAVGRATKQDRVGRAAPRHYTDWGKLLADGSAPHGALEDAPDGCRSDAGGGASPVRGHRKPPGRSPPSRSQCARRSWASDRSDSASMSE